MLALQNYYELKLVIVFYVLKNLPDSDMKLRFVMNITNICIVNRWVGSEKHNNVCSKKKKCIFLK